MQQDRIDARACLATFIMHIPYLLLMTVAGALLGSGLYLLIASLEQRTHKYDAETEYYIDFSEGRLEARDYYNDFTWNDVIATDEILGKTMERLGEGYAREQIKEMITADILSDVRYLTITVEGTDEVLVEKVSEETAKSLEDFGATKKEFNSISLIENNGVRLKEKKMFTIRAMVLGMLTAIIAYCIVFFIKFYMEEGFYTRTDVMKLLQIPCLGIFTKENHKKYIINNICSENIKYVIDEKNQKVTCLNLGKADITDAYQGENAEFLMYNGLNNNDYEKIRQTSGVVLFIPWGKENRNIVTDVIYNLQTQDCTILGAVLTEADAKWLSLYGLC